MPTFDEASLQAAEILSKKSKGPNGVIAYAVVNDTKKRTDGVEIPYYNPDSANPAKLAYAFCETDRVGVPVVSIPGGTQDVLAHKDGQEIRVELTKEDNLVAVLAQIGEANPGIKDVDALEKHTLAKLIEKGWDVAIEPQFVAAVRETSEEQGLDLTNKAAYVGVPKEFERPAMTKRTVQVLEKKHGASLDLTGAKDLADVHAVIQKAEEKVGRDNPDLRSPQMLYAVQVPDFENVALANSGEKVEKKIKGRIGAKYYEKGTFATLEGMEAQLEKAVGAAQEQEAGGNSFARQDVVATYERLQILKKIEAGIVKDLKAQGVAISSNVPERLADKADRELPEFAGQAPTPDMPGVRSVPRAVGETHRG